MRVQKVIEHEDGTASFQGTLEGPELDYVVQLGLNHLMMHNLLPIVKIDHNLHLPEEHLEQ